MQFNGGKIMVGHWFSRGAVASVLGGLRARRRPRALPAALVLGAMAAMTLVTTPASAATTCITGAVNIVAHPDDDLFFVNPLILQDIKAGKCSTTVYVTSGDAGQSASYYQKRELGVRAAYAKMAGVADKWSTNTVTVGSKKVTRTTLTAKPAVTLYFMNLPDGFADGSGSTTSGGASLEKLYKGTVTSIRTLATPRETYTRADVIDTLGRLMLATPLASAVRTLDFGGSFGDGDHSDHHAVGRFVNDARSRYMFWAPITGYLGYTTTRLPANVAGADLQAKSDALFAYAPYDPGTCRSTLECSYSEAGSWLARVHTNTEKPVTPTGTNVAGKATATASSENAWDGQTAAKAIDGVISGYPGDPTTEWATSGAGAGSWLQLTWPGPVQLNAVSLFDRPNLGDQVTAATLTFSDGSTVAVPALDNDGTGTTIGFPARTTTTLRITVTAVGPATTNVGLSEVQTWGSGPVIAPPPPAPTGSNVAGTATATASSENVADGQTAAKAIDGVINGYPGDYTAEWATSGGRAGSWLQLTWAGPVQLNGVVLFDRPNVGDQITGATLTFSDGSTVSVPALDNAGKATTVSFPARSTTSLRITVTSVSASTQNVGLSEIQAWGTGPAIATAPAQVAPMTTSVAPSTTTTTTTTPSTTSTTPPPSAPAAPTGTVATDPTKVSTPPESTDATSTSGVVPTS
jgi:LmbE family N-acetylglucosaminyl deacetylase